MYSWEALWLEQHLSNCILSFTNRLPSNILFYYLSFYFFHVWKFYSQYYITVLSCNFLNVIFSYNATNLKIIKVDHKFAFLIRISILKKWLSSGKISSLVQIFVL